MKPAPKDWPRISSSVVCRDAAAEITWLCEAFGFELRLKVEGDAGRIEHSELIYGEGLVMVSQESLGPEQDSHGAKPWKRFMRSPQTAGGGTQAMMIFVDDADAHCAHARSKGARILSEPETHDYGDAYWSDRSYAAIDPEGHLWWITQRLRDPPAR